MIPTKDAFIKKNKKKNKNKALSKTVVLSRHEKHKYNLSRVSHIDLYLANSTDDALSVFPRILDLTFHENCPSLRLFARNVKTCFLCKIRRYFKMSPAKVLSRVLSLKK